MQKLAVVGVLNGFAEVILQLQSKYKTNKNYGRQFNTHHIQLTDKWLKIRMLEVVWKHLFRELLNLITGLNMTRWSHLLTLRMTIVSPFAPHPQLSEYSGLLNISKVLVRNPGMCGFSEDILNNRKEEFNKTSNNLNSKVQNVAKNKKLNDNNWKTITFHTRLEIQ